MSTYYKEGLTANHISTNLSAYEAARSGFFSFIIDDLDGLIKATYAGDPAKAKESDRYTNAQEYIKLNVTKCPVPNFSISKLQYKRGNEIVNFAGTPEWSDGTIEVDDVVGLDTKGILNAWKNKAYDPHSRKGGRMKDYKKTCTLIEYTQDYEPIRSWTLYGCWISALSESDFDKENDDKRKISATIIYDRAIPEEVAEEDLV